MHNDEVVWQVLGNSFCSFKAKILTDVFCRNPYNVTGLCNRVSCPLANGYYATVREEEGRCYLCLKTIERCHTPRKMWERIELSQNLQEALKQIDQYMTNIYKDHQIHRCKQRYTRLRQTIIRMRKMQLTPQTRLVPVKQKTERREQTREKKAEVAARLEVSIEQELLNRLKQGIYGDVYNYDQQTFERILDEQQRLQEEQEQEEDVQHNGFDTVAPFYEDEDDIESEDSLDVNEFRAMELRRELEEEEEENEDDEEATLENDHDLEDVAMKNLAMSDANASDEELSHDETHHPVVAQTATLKKRARAAHSAKSTHCVKRRESAADQKEKNATKEKDTRSTGLKTTAKSKKPNRNVPRVEVEYEMENGDSAFQTLSM